MNHRPVHPPHFYQGQAGIQIPGQPQPQVMYPHPSAMYHQAAFQQHFIQPPPNMMPPHPQVAQHGAPPGQPPSQRPPPTQTPPVGPPQVQTMPPNMMHNPANVPPMALQQQQQQQAQQQAHQQAHQQAQQQQQQQQQQAPAQMAQHLNPNQPTQPMPATTYQPSQQPPAPARTYQKKTRTSAITIIDPDTGEPLDLSKEAAKTAEKSEAAETKPAEKQVSDFFRCLNRTLLKQQSFKFSDFCRTEGCAR